MSKIAFYQPVSTIHCGFGETEVEAAVAKEEKVKELKAKGSIIDGGYDTPWDDKTLNKLYKAKNGKPDLYGNIIKSKDIYYR